MLPATPTSVPGPTPVATPGTTTPAGGGQTAAATPGGGTPGGTPGGKPKTRNPGAGATGYQTARLRGAFINHVSSYGSTLDGDAADQFAPEAAYTTFSQPGLHLAAEVWACSAKTLGFNARFQASAVRLGLGEEKPFYLPLDVEVGGRYRAWDNGTWSAYGALGFARATELAFEYTTAERVSAKPVGFGIMGAGVGGGLRGEWGAGMFELDLQTIWAPVPSVARLEVRGDLPVAEPVLLHLGLSGEGRLSRWRPDPDDKEVKIRTRRAGVGVRAGVAFAF